MFKPKKDPISTALKTISSHGGAKLDEVKRATKMVKGKTKLP